MSKMAQKLRALVISHSIAAQQDIQAAFQSSPDMEVVLYNEASTSAHQQRLPNVLILHSDKPVDRLRQLRMQGYKQPALILTDSDSPRMAPLEEDIRPLENVTWAVLRTGGLPLCVNMLLNLTPA
jgi:hypothetical protein